MLRARSARPFFHNEAVCRRRRDPDFMSNAAEANLRAILGFPEGSRDIGRFGQGVKAAGSGLSTLLSRATLSRGSR
jgi:hypothetical protein